MEAINDYDSLLTIINDIINNNNINIQTDTINQIKSFYSSTIPFNTSNEYIIVSLINSIEYSGNIDEFKIPILLNKLNELVVLFETQRVEQNTYQCVYQFIQYLHSVKNYGVNSNNLQLPPPVVYYPGTENQSQLQLVFNETPKTEIPIQYVDNNSENKCSSKCFQCICVLCVFAVSFPIAVGLFAFGSWLFYVFHS